MDKADTTSTLGFKVSPAAAGELSALAENVAQPQGRWDGWMDSYIDTSPSAPERGAATTAPFAELLRRAETMG